MGVVACEGGLGKVACEATGVEANTGVAVPKRVDCSTTEGVPVALGLPNKVWKSAVSKELRSEAWTLSGRSKEK